MKASGWIRARGTAAAWLVVLVALVAGDAIVPPASTGAQTGDREVKRLLLLHAGGNTASWNAAGTVIATASGGVVRVWDAQTLQQRYYVEHGGGMNGIEFDATGDRFLTWSYAELRLWETDTGRLLGRLALDNGQFKGVAWDGDHVLNWHGATIGRWDGASAQNSAAVVVPGGNLASVSWNRARTHFLTWNAADTEVPVVRGWRVEGELDAITQVLTLQHDDERIRGAAWSPDETMILTWSQRMVKIWDAETTAQTPAARRTPLPPATATAIPTPGPTVIPAPAVTPVPSDALRATLNDDGYVTSAVWSPNSRYVLVNDIHASRFRVWDVQTGEEVLSVAGLVALWDTTGDRVLVGVNNPRLLDVATGEALAQFGPGMAVSSAARWNPDGVRLLVNAGAVQVLIIPPETQCVVHALSPATRRAAPSLDAERVGVLMPRQLAFVSGQAPDTSDIIWWRLDDGAWVRSDIVESTGRCD